MTSVCSTAHTGPYLGVLVVRWVGKSLGSWFLSGAVQRAEASLSLLSGFFSSRTHPSHRLTHQRFNRINVTSSSSSSTPQPNTGQVPGEQGATAINSYTDWLITVRDARGVAAVTSGVTEASWGISRGGGVVPHLCAALCSRGHRDAESKLRDS